MITYTLYLKLSDPGPKGCNREIGLNKGHRCDF
jgi:hypothetical protein